MIGRRKLLASGVAVLAIGPHVALAQTPGRTYKIAVWHRGFPLAAMAAETGASSFRAFFGEIERLGFNEGRNLVVWRYGTEGREELYAPTARAMVSNNPDVIVANGSVNALYVLEETKDIPIVVTSGADPLAFGYVESLSRPGGNVTGFTIDGGIELNSARMQLLKQVDPTIERIGYLVNRGALIDRTAQDLHRAASALGVEFIPHIMDGTFDDTAYHAAFADFVSKSIDALFVSTAAEHRAHRALIIDLAAQAKVPAIYPYNEYARDGGLMVYGVNLDDNYRRAAGYVARILNGDDPAEMPFQQPTKFDLLINQKTARALGTEIPPKLLIQATEIIE